MRKPETITLQEVEKNIGLQPSEWEGACYALACTVAGLLGQPDAVAYGHWTGPLRGAYWAPRASAGVPFVHHAWVALPDGRVFDPTRWSFEGRDPYLYVGPPDHYDEGGNGFRRALLRPPPDPKVTKLAIGPALRFEKRVASHVLALLGDVVQKNTVGIAVYLTLTREQAFWLANVPPDMLNPHTFEVFEVLARAYSSTLIPIDNARSVARQAGRPRDYFSTLK